MNTTDDIPQSDIYCTEPFEANSDVSGIGVSTQLKFSLPIHFGRSNTVLPDSHCVLSQAILNFFFSTVIEILRYFFRHKAHLREWLKALQFGLITDWVTVGFAMTIAGLSQWRTISMFHLFLCSNLADVIGMQIPSWRGLKQWRSSRLQIVYFTSYSMLRIALLSYLIYRFVRFWSNTPGECFIPFEGGTGSPDELDILILGMGVSIAWDAYFVIAAIVEIHGAMNCRSQEKGGTVEEVQDTDAASTINQKTQGTVPWAKRKMNALIFLAKLKMKTQDRGLWTKRTKHVIIFLAKFVLRGFIFTWNAY